MLVGGAEGRLDPLESCDVVGCNRYKGGQLLELAVSKHHAVRVVPCAVCYSQLRIHGFLPARH